MVDMNVAQTGFGKDVASFDIQISTAYSLSRAGMVIPASRA